MKQKIFDLNKAIQLARKLKATGDRIILVGGCFDILHIGHIKFLEAAKKMGGKLYILLESDEKVKKLKGENRPIFRQEDRAETLASLEDTDVIVNLPYLSGDSEYQKIIGEVKPNIIAVCENDPILTKKIHQAKKIKAQLRILPLVKSLSSSKLAEILGRENI